MIYNNLHREVIAYSRKIITEDLEFLSDKKSLLDDVSWKLFLDKYEKEFVRKNRLLFELLITSKLPYAQMGQAQIRDMSLRFTHKTLHEILFRIPEAS